MALNVKRVARLSSPGRYGDGNGLYLQINPAGVKSWLFRYERAGRERLMGLGPLHAFNLYEARERARRARQLLADGIDPLEAARKEKAARVLEAEKRLLFRDAARAYYEAHEKKWRNAKHAAQFLSTLETYAFPVIGSLGVAEIDTALVLKVIEPIWHKKTETASRLRSRIEAVLAWATVRGFRTGDNPARWRGHLREVLPARGQIQKTNHHAALPYSEIAAFMAGLATREGFSARALELTILTAARTGEVIFAKWPEFDLTARVWTVPADRMKARKEHRVPLSDRAVKLLEKLPRERGNDFVFVGPKKGTALSNMAMLTLLRRMDRTDLTVHGFRSTFRDWAAERTNFPREVAEMALAHTIGDDVEAAYRRGDLFAKRAKLMEAWSVFCATKAVPADNVRPLRGVGRV